MASTDNRKIMNYFGKGAFEFCTISHILFAVRAGSSRKPVLADSSPVGDCVVVGLSLIFRVLPGVLAIGRCSLMV